MKNNSNHHQSHSASTTQVQPVPITWRDLLYYEFQQLGKSSLLWLVLLLFTVLLCWSAINTATLQEEQRQAIEAQMHSEAAWYEELRQRAKRYAQPGQEQVPYWQDPTDVAGFTAYMLKAHTAKPHLPMAPLSLGQSDLLPYIIPIKLNTLFGIETAYDFEAPRSLMLGAFDSGFVLTYLLPLMLALLVAVLGSYERDHQLLRLIAAQGPSSRHFVLLRIVSLSIFVIPAVLLASVIALIVGGASISKDIAAFFSALILIACYCLFWLACGAFILCWHKGSAATAAAQFGVWVMLAMGIPLGATLLSSYFLPSPSRVMEIDLLRQVSDDVSAERDNLVEDWLQSNRKPGYEPATPSYSAKLTIVVPEMERRLQPQQDASANWRNELIRWSSMVNFFSPPSAMQTTLSQLAGTDGERHQRFLEASRAYQQQLRNIFYTKIQQEVLQPTDLACPTCAGKLQFTRYDTIPRFQFTQSDTGKRAGAALFTSLSFLIVGLLLLIGVILRGARWRQEDLS